MTGLNSKNGQDVVVIGGGPTGVAAVRGLYRNPSVRSITVVERHEVGLGQAFGKLCAGDPAFICNSSIGTMFIDEDQPDEFAQYLVDSGWPVSHDDYVPRYLFGEFARDRYLKMVREARERDVVITHVRATASRIRKTGDAYEVELDNGANLAATDIMLCTGLESHAIPDLLQPFTGDERLILGAYPAAPLRSLEHEGPVLIIGLRSTALDAMFTLCRFGRRVVLTSPSGRLSAVRDRQNIPELNPFDIELWRPALERQDAEEITELLRSTMVRNNDTFPLSDQVSFEEDLVPRLREEYALAEAGATKWGDITFDVINLINSVVAPWGDEQRRNFLVPLKSTLTRYVNALPPLTARRLLKYIDAGQASVSETFPRKLERTADGWTVTWGDGTEEQFAYVVSAGGFHVPRFHVDSQGALVVGNAGSIGDNAIATVDDYLRVRLPGESTSERIWTLGPASNQRFPLAHIIFLAARQAGWIGRQLEDETVSPADLGSHFTDRKVLV